MDFLADTTLLIDLWREQKKPGVATAFAKRNAHLSAGIPWVVAGEFISGSVLAGHNEERQKHFLQQYLIIHSTMEIVQGYARLFAFVRQRRMNIGPNDLWIAATAATLDLPLATRNVGDYHSLPDVRLIDYTVE